MITKADIFDRREEILAIGRRYGATDFRVFGSFARGDATPASDLDLLVRFAPDRSLIDHGLLIEDLMELLHIRVDVVSEGALRTDDRFAREVNSYAVPL